MRPLSPAPVLRKTKLLKLTWAKVPLSVEEGGLCFRDSAVCDIPSLHSLFYDPIS